MAHPSTSLANDLFIELLAGTNITIPSLDLNDPIYNLPFDSTSTIFDPVEKLTNDDLTTGEVGGSGTFDALMKGFGAHLKKEYDMGRITGAEYTKAYIALTQSAMGNAVQYLTTRDASFWQAVQAQIAAIRANVQLAQSKVEYATLYIRALTEEANYALAKLSLAVTNVEYEVAGYNLSTLLPDTHALNLDKQKQYDIEYDTSTYNLSNTLPAQLNIIKENLELVEEKVETQRAETLNDRRDNSPITGSVGKQKDLYTQQIESYKRDSEVKAARIFTDSWTAIKTVNSATVPPNAFNNTNLDDILNKVENNTFNP